MSRLSLLAVVVAALFAPAASANAACTSSTPSAAAYTDPVDGDLGLAPEITTVGVSVDASCHLVVDPGIAAPHADGDGVFVYIDSDGNPSRRGRRRASRWGRSASPTTTSSSTSLSTPARSRCR
jgi:hypothetical protein